VPRPLDHRLESNMQWGTLLLETAKLCQIQAAVAVLITMVMLVLVAVRWMRRYHRQTLILLRAWRSICSRTGRRPMIRCAFKRM